MQIFRSERRSEAVGNFGKAGGLSIQGRRKGPSGGKREPDKGQESKGSRSSKGIGKAKGYEG